MTTSNQSSNAVNIEANSSQSIGTHDNSTPSVSSAESNGDGDQGFDFSLIRKYPRSNRKVTLEIRKYSILAEDASGDATQSVHISPHGIEFHALKDYPEGTLLKIHVNLPDYWNRKQRFVEYRRIDAPGNFKVLAKVVKSEDIGKRGKKKLVTVQTVNMDDVDEQVLKAFLQDG